MPGWTIKQTILFEWISLTSTFCIFECSTITDTATDKRYLKVLACDMSNLCSNATLNKVQKYRRNVWFHVTHSTGSTYIDTAKTCIAGGKPLRDEKPLQVFFSPPNQFKKDEVRRLTYFMLCDIQSKSVYPNRSQRGLQFSSFSLGSIDFKFRNFYFYGKS